MRKRGFKWLASVFLGLVSTLGFVFADTGDCPGCGGMMGGWMFGGMGMGFFGWIISLLVVVALILLIVWLIKQISKK